jgi:hypothetical protein
MNFARAAVAAGESGSGTHDVVAAGDCVGAVESTRRVSFRIRS